MNTLELTQRQRELLGNIVKAANQYRQAVADASARFERENEQIEQRQRQERQRIEEEREQKTKVTFKKPAKTKMEQKRREGHVQRLQHEITAKRSTTTPPRGMTTIEAVKKEINELSSRKIRVSLTPNIWTSYTTFKDHPMVYILGLIFLFSCCGSFYIFNDDGRDVGWLSLPIFIISVGILVVVELRRRGEERALINRIVLLHNLYDRWLELVDEQAGAQRAEAQRHYDQALAQAKGQMLAAAEQLRPAIAEFGALTERVSPSWESEAWRQWEPGRVGPGAVRLGTFKMEV